MTRRAATAPPVGCSSTISAPVTSSSKAAIGPGNGWTGAHSWFGRSYGTPNAAVMLGIADPADNYVYEFHQYLDANYSGTHPECKNETIGVTALTAVTDWLRQHKKRGFLGEFGAGSNPTLQQVIENPQIYGGPATNSVADYLSNFFFGTPIGSGIESCPGPDFFTAN